VESNLAVPDTHQRQEAIQRLVEGATSLRRESMVCRRQPYRGCSPPLSRTQESAPGATGARGPIPLLRRSREYDMFGRWSRHLLILMQLATTRICSVTGPSTLGPKAHGVCPGFLPLRHHLCVKLQRVHACLLPCVRGGPTACRTEAGQGF
jgi:hypothetical protein